MKLVLNRKTETDGTVKGDLYLNGALLGPVIENKEYLLKPGKYGLQRRYSEKFKNHILITGTEPRELILMHPGTKKEHSKGCLLIKRAMIQLLWALIQSSSTITING